MRYVQLFDWGWDSHGTDADNALDIGLRNKCREIDRPMTALLLDLKQRGLLDQTLVVWGSEFGRTPMQENREGKQMPFYGRDHHLESFTMWMAGGGIKQGTTWGETDEIGYYPVQGKVSLHDVQATILNQLGLNHEALTYEFQGRPFRLTDVYGKVICDVPATEMVEQGYILPPTVVPYVVDYERLKGDLACNTDHVTLLNMIDEMGDDANHKILVAVPSSKVMWNLLSQTTAVQDLQDRGFDVLHITSKYGAWVNQTKVNREVFFDTFNDWGKDPSRKFVIFHYSILAEGINVHGLTHTILLRTLDVIEMAQTIGRVIRLNKDDAADLSSGKIAAGNFSMYRKPTGFVTVPVFKNYGQRTIDRLQNLVNTIFVEGKPAISVVNR